MRKLFYLLSSASLFVLTAGVYADEEATATAKGGFGGSMQMFIMIGIALGLFYFIVLRPERKRRKALEAQRSAVKKGDRVTMMGILGTVAQVKEETLVLRLVDGAKMEVLKAAVSEVQPATEESSKTVEMAGDSNG